MTGSGSLLRRLLAGYRRLPFCRCRWATYRRPPSVTSSTRAAAPPSIPPSSSCLPLIHFNMILWLIRLPRLPTYPDPRTIPGALTSVTSCGSQVATIRPSLTPPTRWTSTIRWPIAGRLAHRSPRPGATLPLTPMAAPTSGWAAAMMLAARR